MKTSIYKPRPVSKVLVVACVISAYVIIFLLLSPTSWMSIFFPALTAAWLVSRFLRDKIELSDESIINRNAYMNKKIALERVVDVDYVKHWYGEGAVVTFRNQFDVINKMNISSLYNVEDIVEEIHTRKYK